MNFGESRKVPLLEMTFALKMSGERAFLEERQPLQKYMAESEDCKVLRALAQSQTA